MNKAVGNILSLHISRSDNRECVESLDVDSSGVVGDKFYGKNPNRSILITTAMSYALADENGISLSVGDLGENIVMNFNPYTLDANSRFKIGEVLFEISQHCPVCKGLSAVDKRLPKLLKEGRGIFVKAVTSGTITVSDRIYLVE